MNHFSARPVINYNLPLAVDVSILKPQEVALRFATGGTIDIGSLCYLKREANGKQPGRRKEAQGRRVVLSSLCRKRVKHIRAFIAYISQEAKNGGKRPSTLHTIVSNFMVFMAWADSNGHSCALDDSTTVRSAVIAYAAYVRERVTTHSIKLNTGSVSQRKTFALISDFMGIENLTRGINLLHKNRSSEEPTPPPDEANQGRVLRLCEALFTGLTTRVLEESSYPFGIAMPEYLGYHENTMWVFPVLEWCMPAERLDAPWGSSRVCPYDYKLGRLVSQDELKVGYKGKSKQPKTNINKLVSAIYKRIRGYIDLANSTSMNGHRRVLGMLAHNAFIPLFLSRTGMNWTQAVELTWVGDSKGPVSTLRQNFRSIKYRAGNKNVFFQLPLKFVPLFKRFLQLRDYLLQDHPEFEGMFFTMGICAKGVPTSIKTSLASIFSMLKRIDPGLSQVLSRGWRAAKSNWVIPRADVSTAAQLMQSSEPTVLKSYAAGSETVHLTEMSTYLDQMLVEKEALLDSRTNAVGDCVSYGNPLKINNVVTLVPPDCKKPDVGCLSCDKFKVHADETDVRKLLSCRYCLTRTSHLAGINAVAGPLVERIDHILNEVNKRDAGLVPRITKEVEDGELAPYWASKFDMLLRLGLVNDID